MVRIVRTPPGNVVVDTTGKLAGRGAYLCRRAACWESGLRRSALERALKAPLPAADREALEAFAAALTAEADGAARPGLAEGRTS
jgi:predicted RNA-binding protein YlxR (DUF448 family)